MGDLDRLDEHPNPTARGPSASERTPLVGGGGARKSVAAAAAADVGGTFSGGGGSGGNGGGGGSGSSDSLAALGEGGRRTPPGRAPAPRECRSAAPSLRQHRPPRKSSTFDEADPLCNRGCWHPNADPFSSRPGGQFGDHQGPANTGDATPMDRRNRRLGYRPGHKLVTKLADIKIKELTKVSERCLGLSKCPHQNRARLALPFF